jgi:hypothetical protein
MVHTLSEIERVLAPDGILIDLRPILDRWHIQVTSARETRQAGRMQDFDIGLADDEAANRAAREAEANRWFTRESEEFFPLIYSWDSASEMEEWIEDEWHDFMGLSQETKHAARSAWALGDGDTRVRVDIKMLITRWRKLQPLS